MSCEKFTVARNIWPFIFVEEGRWKFFFDMSKCNTRKNEKETEITNMTNGPMELCFQEPKGCIKQNMLSIF